MSIKPLKWEEQTFNPSYKDHPDKFYHQHHIKAKTVNGYARITQEDHGGEYSLAFLDEEGLPITEANVGLGNFETEEKAKRFAWEVHSGLLERRK